MRIRTIVHSLLLLLLGQGVQAAKPVQGWESQSRSLSHPAIALASDDTVNPLRGWHRWRNLETVPQSEPALEAYQRYQWRDLEPTLGQYSFTTLLNDLALARSEGRKFALRVRMMAGYDDGQVYLPADLVNHPSCAAGCGFWADDDSAVPGLTFVPDWNDAFLQQRTAALLNALAAALGSSVADLAWIDVGLYGQYGEWTIHSGLYASAPPGVTAISDASKRALAEQHFRAFPGVRQLMFALYNNRDALNYGLNQQTLTSLPVGLRVDCLSRAGFFDQWIHHPSDWALFSTRWQTAPFVSEFCPFSSGDTVNNAAVARQQAAQFHLSSISNGNIATSLPAAQRWASFSAAEQNDLLMLGREAGYRYALSNSQFSLTPNGALSLSATLQNLGNAPAYEPWALKAELVNGSGAVVWSAALPHALGSLTGAGSSQGGSGSFTLPSSLASGSYTLRLVVRSTASAAPRRALKLVNVDRNNEGGVVLGSLRKR